MHIFFRECLGGSLLDPIKINANSDVKLCSYRRYVKKSSFSSSFCRDQIINTQHYFVILKSDVDELTDLWTFNLFYVKFELYRAIDVWSIYSSGLKLACFLSETIFWLPIASLVFRHGNLDI